MTGVRTYLDFNATAPLRPVARQAVVEALDIVGNPSSVHAEGRRARAVVDDARDAVAALINAKPAEVVFTSGATEANGSALTGVLAGAYGYVVMGALEHESVRVAAQQMAGLKGVPVVELPCSRDGVVDVERLPTLIGAGDVSGRALVLLQLANNETGVVQPIARAVELGSEHGFDVHTDAVQGAGRVAIDFRALGVASMSLSAHKLGGPKGIGALVIRAGCNLMPLIAGGGQERRRRGGTENVAAIAGFGAAAKAALAELAVMERVARLRDEFEAEVIRTSPTAVIIGAEAKRLPNTSCIALPGRSAETLVIKLDLAGIAVSAGAACSSGKVGQSHVLTAMGLGHEIARSAIRVSIGANTTREDLAAFLAAWREIAAEAQLAA